MTCPPRLHPITPALVTIRTHLRQRQLAMAFESPGLQGMSPAERASAVSQLAMLLMQAAGVQLPGARNDKL